jgi:hypothetical protein
MISRDSNYSQSQATKALAIAELLYQNDCTALQTKLPQQPTGQNTDE